MLQHEDTAAGGDLSLEADTGESILVKGVDSFTQEDGAFFTELKTERLSVGYFNTKKLNANHLQCWTGTCSHGNLLDQMIKQGLLAGYPVAEGETFKVHNAEAVAKYRAVYYETYDAGDMLPEMPNGSKSKEFSFVNYGTNDGAMTANSYGEADKSLNPSEYPAFPFGADVPSKTEIDIHAVLILNFDPTGATATTRDEVRDLRLTKDREVLWDKTRVGQYLTQGVSRLSWGCSRQAKGMIVKWLPAPLKFLAGEELKVEVSCGATLIADSELEIAFIETVRRTD